MVAALHSPPKPAPAEQRFRLSGIPWRSYLRISEELQTHTRVRINYSRGELELMTISTLHDRYKKWLGQFVIILAEETDRPLLPNGSMTFRSEALDRGFEPDECFWIDHEAQMRSVTQWRDDLHPPPDLLLEIELSQTFVDRMEIAGAIKAPEVWRFDGRQVGVWRLLPDGGYSRSSRSRFFPEIDLAQLDRFMALVVGNDFLATMRSFRAWVREQLENLPHEAN